MRKPEPATSCFMLRTCHRMKTKTPEIVEDKQQKKKAPRSECDLTIINHNPVQKLHSILVIPGLCNKLKSSFAFFDRRKDAVCAASAVGLRAQIQRERGSCANGINVKHQLLGDLYRKWFADID